MNQKAYGFTIVELLVVIVVIGILAVISTVAYNGISARAEAGSTQSAARQLTTKIAVVHADTGRYPVDLQSIDIHNTGNTSYQYELASGEWCTTVTVGRTSYYVSSHDQLPSEGGCPGHGQGGASQATNWATNPSFETGRDGCYWANGAGYTGALTTEMAYAGSQSFKITAPGAVADRYLECTPQVTQGTYIISAQVYLTGMGATFGDRHTMFGCASGSCSNQEPTPRYDLGSLDQWQRISNQVTANGPATLRIRLYTPSNSTIYVDGISVMDTASNYADGDSDNWVWNGTPHQSTSTGPAR